MSETPRTDAAAQGFSAVNINFARTLERELGEANAKLSKLSRMIDISGQANDAASEAEVANSATFLEALAHTNTEMVEAERDQLRADLKESDRDRVRLAALVSTERYRTQQWRAVAEQAIHAIKVGNDHGYGLRIGDDTIAAYESLKNNK